MRQCLLIRTPIDLILGTEPPMKKNGARNMLGSDVCCPLEFTHDVTHTDCFQDLKSEKNN
jgi:hypothetical protein